MNTKIFLLADTHRNQQVVVIRFAFNIQVLDVLKENFPAHWSQSKRCWWIARKKFDYKKFKEAFSIIAEIILPPKKQLGFIPI